MPTGESTMSETHWWAIDRFEGELAVVEIDGGRFLDVPRWLLPPEAGEDEVVRIERRVEHDGAVRLLARIDAEETDRRRAEARRLIDELRRKDPGGDVTL